MTDVAFPTPVLLRMAGRGERQVSTSFEALECLEREWPEWARGRRWRSAVTTCRDSLDGWRTGVDARRSFLRAAEAAGLLPVGKRTRTVQRWGFSGPTSAQNHLKKQPAKRIRHSGARAGR